MPKKVHNALTPLQVKNAKPGRHADGSGLYLLVKDTGARSWVYRYMRAGKSRDVGLGSAATDGISLATARDLATALRLKVRAGIDPLAEREAATAGALATEQAKKIAAITFKTVAGAYITTNEAGWRNEKHRQQWRKTWRPTSTPSLAGCRWRKSAHRTSCKYSNPYGRRSRRRPVGFEGALSQCSMPQEPVVTVRERTLPVGVVT